MVGVPGKSKGCNTCRRRKIKCDGQKPGCGQCRKGTRICGGYERDLHFKNLSALDHDSLLARAQPLIPLTSPSVAKPLTRNIQSNYSSQDQPLAIDPGFIPSHSTDSFQQDEELAGDHIHKGTASNTVVFPRHLALNDAATVKLLFARFMDGYVPPGSFNGPKSFFPLSWLQVLLELPHYSKSLDLAVGALSMVRLGRAYRDERLKVKGMEVYGQALTGMQKLLLDQNAILQEQTFAISMTMSVFEILETSDNEIQGWISHVDGLSQLVQLRGPAAHINGSSHQLFLGFRPTEIIHALVLQAKTYLAEPEWLTIPWMCSTKTDLHSLLDIIAKLPEVLGDTRAILNHSSRNNLAYIRAHLNNSRNLEHTLQAWYLHLIGKSKNVMYAEVYHQHSDIDNVFPTMLHFDDLEMARVHCFYWSSLLLLYNSLFEILQYSMIENGVSERMLLTTSTFPWVAGKSVSDLVKENEDKSMTVAELIAKSMHFLLSEDMRTLGLQNIFFPLRIAMHIFSRHSRTKVQWCRNKFTELDARGFPFAKILNELEWDEIPRKFAASRTI